MEKIEFPYLMFNTLKSWAFLDVNLSQVNLNNIGLNPQLKI